MDSAKVKTTYTLEEAFDYDAFSPALNREKVMRAVSLLLKWTADIGNRDVDGYIALGLANITDLCAKEMVQYRKERDDYMLPAPPTK